MQTVKDSFYMALRERAQSSGTGCAQLAVVENERSASLARGDVFFVRFMGLPEVPDEATVAGWRKMRCEIGYRTDGSELSAGEDRGRKLSELDAQLRRLLEPRWTALMNYEITPAEALGERVLWTAPEFGAVEDGAEGIQRQVTLTLLWRAEESQI